MPPALHHALLGLSVAALASGGLRAASPVVPSGLARVLVAATFASAAAVAEALALGLLAVGGSTAALTLAALGTWVAARALLPDPAVAPTGELADWWRARSTGERTALGALVGAAAAWAAWQLRYPALGFDTVIYHLPEIVLWVQNGTPGSIEDVLPGLPVGNYPLTAEVTVAWGMGISRSYVPLTLFPWATLALTVASGWAGLPALGVRKLPRALALAALCTSPWLLAWQSNGSVTDPPALAWLVTCAALCVLGRERPALLGPAIVAGGLAVGCKTTVLPFTLLVLLLAIWPARSRIRSALARRLGLALGAALAVGGVWYLRNLFAHGSPFWPIVSAPWGDPVPPSIDVVHTTFVGRLGPTLDRLGDDYLHRFGGGIVLLAGGALAVLAAPRSRRVRWASLAVVLGFLLWARSPVTGVPQPNWLDEAIFSTTRYLLPVLAAAALALVLAATERGAGAIVASLVLAATAVVNLAQTFDLGFPKAPSAATPLAGAAAGAVAALVLGRLAGARLRPRRLRLGGPPATAGAGLAVALAASALAIPASGFLERHGGTRPVLTETITRWLAADHGYRAHPDGVATSPAFIGPLAGDRIDHRLSALTGRDSCATIAARARHSWLVVYAGAVRGATPAQVSHCLGGAKPAFDNGAFAAYRPGG